MHFKFSTLICQGMLAPLLAAGTLPLSGWNFSSGPEFPGASGQLRTLPDSLQLSADFRNGGKYVAARYELSRPLRLRELQFQVKSGVPEMTIGFRDTDGKNRQYTLTLSGDPEVWQCVKVPVPGGTEPSPGAKITDLSLTVNAAELPGKRGSIAFRNVLCLAAGFACNVYGSFRWPQLALPRGRHWITPLAWLAGVCLLLFGAMELGGRI